MAMTLRSYMNAKLKAMGKTATQAKKDAGKYKSIAAAKKAGSLYYTDKNGKVMAAVYAEDLKKSPPKPKPNNKPKPKSEITVEPLVVGSMTKSDIEKQIAAGKNPTGKQARIAKLQAEKRRLQKIIDAGKKKKPPVVKRREQARIREINSILKQMK